MYSQERFDYHKRPFWPILCLKRIGIPFCTFVTIIITCSLQIILLSNYSATYNFSTCRHYLAKNHLSFPSAPCWVRHSYLSKRLQLIPYTCGSSRLFSGAVTGEWSTLGKWKLVRKNITTCWNLLSLVNMKNNPLRGLFEVSSPRPEPQLVIPQPTSPTEKI